MATNSTIEEIFTDARFALADSNGTRWSNERLLVLLNSGIKNIVFNTDLLKAETFILLAEGQQVYNASELALKITRVEYEGSIIPLTTHSDMDKRDLNWDETVADKIKAVIYDKTDRGLFKVYPRPQSISTFVQSSAYGVITDIRTVDDILYNADTPGELGNDIVQSDYIKLYYVVNPTKYVIADLANPIILPDIWDDILLHWIVGKALKDDREEQNRIIGADNLKEYEKKLSGMKTGAVQDFTASVSETRYNGGF